MDVGAGSGAGRGRRGPARQARGAAGGPRGWTMEGGEGGGPRAEVLARIALRRAPVAPDETGRPPRVWTGEVVRLLVRSPHGVGASRRFMRWMRQLRELSVPVAGRAM